MKFQEPQTRSQQQKILEAAKKDGSLSELYWYMVSGNEAIALRSFEGQATVLALPVGQDPEISRHWAHLMLELIQEHNPKKALRLEITLLECLNDFGSWKDWAEIDFICPGCGAVNDCMRLQSCKE